MFNSGDRVAWKYRHYTNGTTYTVREKVGEYIGRVRYRPGGLYGPIEYDNTRALVWFDGNKRWSKVKMTELRIVAGSKQ